MMRNVSSISRVTGIIATGVNKAGYVKHFVAGSGEKSRVTLEIIVDAFGLLKVWFLGH